MGALGLFCGRHLPAVALCIASISNMSLAHANNPYFTLDPYQENPAPSEPNAAAIGDVTGDGLPDVILSTPGGYGDFQNHVLVYRQTASGELQAYGEYPSGQFGFLTGLEVLDLDGAHARDVAVGGHVGVTFVRSQPDGTMLSSAPVVAKGATFLVSLDMNGDNLADIAAVGYDGAHIQLNNGDGTMTYVEWPAPLNSEGGMAAADIDHDGDDDIVAMGDLGVKIFTNSGAVPPAMTSELPAQCGFLIARSVSVGDVDADGLNDIIASTPGNSPSACVIVYYGSGGGQFLSPGIQYSSYEIPQVIRSADIDLDGRKDIVVLHGGWARLGVYFQQSDGTLAPEKLFPIPFSSHYWPESLAIGDISGDACPDIVFADGHRGFVTLKGRGCFTLFADGFEASDERGRSGPR